MIFFVTQQNGFERVRPYHEDICKSKTNKILLQASYKQLIMKRHKQRVTSFQIFLQSDERRKISKLSAVTKATKQLTANYNFAAKLTN